MDATRGLGVSAAGWPALLGLAVVLGAVTVSMLRDGVPRSLVWITTAFCGLAFGFAGLFTLL